MYTPPLEEPGFVIPPHQAESHRLRHDGNFVGWLLISLLIANMSLSFVLALLQARGVLNLSLMDNTPRVFLEMLMYIFYLAVPVWTVVLISRRKQNPFPTRRVGLGVYVFALFGGMMLAVASNYITGVLMSFMESAGVERPVFEETQSGTPTSLVLNLISTAVLPAILEEMVFRGYVLQAFRRYGDKLAVIVTALLFGLIHGNVLQLPFAFLLGLVFGWMVVQTGSIWPAVILHFGNNAMSVLLDYVKLVVGSSSAATVLTFSILTVLGMIAFAAVYLSNKKRGEDLLRPMSNGASALSVTRRVTGLFTAPVMIVGVLLWCVILVLSIL